MIHRRPHVTQTTIDKPYEPENSRTAFALIKIPEPIMQANSRFIASRRPIVRDFPDGLDDNEGTPAARLPLDGAIYERRNKINDEIGLDAFSISCRIEPR